MNDNISNDVPTDVQEQTFVTLQGPEGQEIRLPIEGETVVVQDTEFSDEPVGN